MLGGACMQAPVLPDHWGGGLHRAPTPPLQIKKKPGDPNAAAEEEESSDVSGGSGAEAPRFDEPDACDSQVRRAVPHDAPRPGPAQTDRPACPV